MGVTDVYLRHFRSFAMTCIFYVKRNGDRCVQIARWRSHRQVAVGKMRVGEPESERKERLDGSPIEMAVAKKHTFRVLNLGFAFGRIVIAERWIIFPTALERYWQLG